MNRGSQNLNMNTPPNDGTEVVGPSQVPVTPVDDLAARRGHRLIRVSDKIERIKKEREEAEEQSAHLRQVNKDLASYLALQLQRCDPTEITDLQANLQQMRAEVGRLLKENEDIRVEKFAADECAEEEKQAGLEEKRARLEAEIQLQELTEELELVRKELLLKTKPDAAVLKEQRGRLEAEVLMKEYREEVTILRAEIKALKEAQQ